MVLPWPTWKTSVVEPMGALPQSLSSWDGIHTTGFGRPSVQPVAMGCRHGQRQVPLCRDLATVHVPLPPLCLPIGLLYVLAQCALVKREALLHSSLFSLEARARIADQGSPPAIAPGRPQKFS